MKAIRRPSGDHAGSKSRAGPRVSARWSAPSARIVHRSKPAPARVKTIRRPSGDHAGSRASMPRVSARASRRWSSSPRRCRGRTARACATARSGSRPHSTARRTRWCSAWHAAAVCGAVRPDRPEVGLGVVAGGHLTAEHERAVAAREGRRRGGRWRTDRQDGGGRQQQGPTNPPAHDDHPRTDRRRRIRVGAVCAGSRPAVSGSGQAGVGVQARDHDVDDQEVERDRAEPGRLTHAAARPFHPAVARACR